MRICFVSQTDYTKHMFTIPFQTLTEKLQNGLYLFGFYVIINVSFIVLR